MPDYDSIDYREPQYREPEPLTGPRGTPPPWMDPSSVGPMAPGVDWSQVGPQQDPNGAMWDWDGNAWVQRAGAPPPVTPTSTPTPTTTPTSMPGPGGGTLGGLLAPFQYRGDAPAALPGVPVFTPPAYTPYERFTDPSMADVAADPGYEFARQEGQRGLEASKAAGGVLNTGGTLKDILAWGNNYATQRYGDVRNRKMDTYLTNYKTQNLDPYEKRYRSALDAFAPQMQAYGTEAAWKQHANDVNWSRAYDVFRDQRDSTFNKVYQVQTA